MKKTIIILSFLALFAAGCKQAKKEQPAQIGGQENTYISDVRPDEKTLAQTEQNQSSMPTQNHVRRKVRHVYSAEGADLICFDDGTAFYEHYDYVVSTGKMDSEKPEDIEPNTTYMEFKESPNCLHVTDREESELSNPWCLFNDFGRIINGWKIINYYNIHSPIQITNFLTANIPAENIQSINETCLIFIAPEESYEEWMWYEDDRKKEFAEMGISSVSAQKRYLSFTLFDGDKITIDTKSKQNGAACSALLYRKGYIPIMISISGDSEEDKYSVNSYMNATYAAEPKFERWKTSNNKQERIDE